MKSEPLNIQTKLEIIEPKVAVGLSTVLGVLTALSAFVVAVIAFLNDSSSPGGIAAIGTSALAVYKVIDSRTAQKLAITPASPPKMIANPIVGTAAESATAGEVVKLWLDGKKVAESVMNAAGGQGNVIPTIHTDPNESASDSPLPTPTADEPKADPVPAVPGDPGEEDEEDGDDDLDERDVSEQMTDFKPSIPPGQEIPPDNDVQFDNLANSGATVLVAADGTVKTV